MANGDAIVIYIWACLKPWENESPIASLLIDPWSTWKIHCYSVFGRTQIISLYNLFLNKHIYILSYFVIYILYYKVHVVSISAPTAGQKTTTTKLSSPLEFPLDFFNPPKALGKKPTPSLYVRPNRERSKKGPRWKRFCAEKRWKPWRGPMASTTRVLKVLREVWPR